MNTVLLQYAVEVEKTGSITQAAVNLYMDQPNLSKAIKSLEESLGAPIFKRTPKGVVPTDRGKIFLEYARGVLIQIDKMEHLYKPGPVSRVEFSLSMPRASYLSEAFTRFVKKISDQESLNVWIKETNSSDTLREVETGEYNLGVIRYQSLSEKYYAQEIASKGLLVEPLFEYSLRLLISEENPLAEKEVIEAEELKSLIEITHGDIGMAFRGDSEKGKASSEISKKIYVFERGSQFSLLCDNPNTYMWVSPMPAHILKRYGLVEKQCIKETRFFGDALIYRKGYALSAWDKAFLKELENVKETLL